MKYRLYKITLFQTWSKKPFESFCVDLENKTKAIQCAKRYLKRTKFSTEVYFEVSN